MNNSLKTLRVLGDSLEGKTPLFHHHEFGSGCTEYTE